MKFFILLFLLFLTNMFSKDINHKVKGCNIPHILIKAIEMTENEESYPYYIRTNSKKSLKKFSHIVSFFKHRKTSDSMLIDCLSKNNCTILAEVLIINGVDNLDLGLYQINYNSLKTLYSKYFDKKASYFLACRIVNNKISETKNWSWETLASYHSKTPSLNRKYKNKLIKNYEKLAKQYR